jgi:hypothetical protein
MIGKVKLLVLALGLAASVTSAHAFYVLEPSEAAGPASQDICLQPGVVGGEVIRDNAPLVGYGNGIPLRTALQMIFPKSWRGIVSPVVEDTKVSWESGSPWIATMSHIAKQNNLCVKVRPADQVLLVEAFVAPAVAQQAPVAQTQPVAPVQQPTAPVVAPTVAPQQVAPPVPMAPVSTPAPLTAEPALVVEEMGSAPAPAVPAPNYSPVHEDQAMRKALEEVKRSVDFTLNEGAQIHEELERWCKASGWTLFWRPSVSWNVIKTTRIPEGDVVAAVQRVIETLRHEKKPVRMEVYRGNNVIEIISTGVAIK